ncbi:MAG: M23 family metallopeptidase [Bacteroidales bacterium]|nr:M23 family metallopeptidase [Bacteroidales bacterium]
MTTVAFAFLIVLLIFFFFGSPKEKMQAREIEFMKLQYQILEDRLDDMEVLVQDMQQRDNNVYRMIFEAEPIPSAVRVSGFAGANRYENLYGYKDSELILKVATKLDMVASQLYFQSKSYDELFVLAKNKSQMLTCIPAIIPLKESEIRQISSYFGYRSDPIYKVQKFHSGMDFAAPLGTEIFATGDGVVEKVESNYWGYGNLITIDHGYGYKTQYAHLSRFATQKGQKVKRGQLIGYVGSTGKSTGSHLHYEVLKNDTPVDPINFFFNDLSPEEYESILKQAAMPSLTMD